MSKAKQAQIPPPAQFQVGDRVKFPFPGRMVEGIVTEDRGCIGWKGRRLLEVEIIEEDGRTGRLLEMPEEELEPA